MARGRLSPNRRAECHKPWLAGSRAGSRAPDRGSRRRLHAAGESSDSEPAFGPESLARTQGALKFYEEIVAQGAGGAAEGARGLKQGARGAFVTALKERLAISGDLDNASGASDLFDAATTAALKRFQQRHGLSETGAVGRLTFAALNVSAEVRLKQLRASVERLQNNVFKFDRRYVVVNIPGAVEEAVSNGKVERRHLAVVGKRSGSRPVISARISSVNLTRTGRCRTRSSRTTWRRR